MPTTFGDPTSPTTTLDCEVHKLHREFEVAAATTVYPLQPVKLNAAGEVVPLGAGDAAYLCIGHSIHKNPATYGERVTVLMKGHLHVLGKAGAAAVDAGPVKWASFDPTTGANAGYHVYAAAADAATTQGWAIEAGGINGFMEIVLAN